jgi:tRNA A37 threonylcarbamoyladenosine modification protein TsaB
VSLILALETSGSDYSVVVGKDDTRAENGCRHDSSSFAGVGELVASTLRQVEAEFVDISVIAVDVGPGYGSVRSGVSYANALSFSLQRPLFVADSLRLLALEIGDSAAEDVLCVRNAGSGIVNAGLFREGVAIHMRSGPLHPVVSALAGTLPAVTVAGELRDRVAAVLDGAKVYDSGIAAPHASTLYDLVTAARPEDPGFVTFARPLNESSQVFVE